MIVKLLPTAWEWHTGTYYREPTTTTFDIPFSDCLLIVKVKLDAEDKRIIRRLEEGIISYKDKVNSLFTSRHDQLMALIKDKPYFGHWMPIIMMLIVHVQEKCDDDIEMI